MRSTVRNDMHMTHKTRTFLDIPVFFSKSLHARRSWSLIFKEQFKADGPNSHAELVHVHSPLLVKSHVGFDPPLTDMIKVSGCTYLISYFKPSPFLKKSRGMQGCSVCNKDGCYTAVLVFILYACLNTSKQFALMCTKFTRHYM